MIILPPKPSPPPEPEPLVRITVYLTDAERARLRRDAKAAGLPVSVFCRSILTMEDTDGAS